MDLNDGQPLLEVLRRAKRERGQPFPLEFRLQVVGEALRALHAAHERHVREGGAPESITRSVSLKSVFIGFDGRVSVDFGTTRDSVDRISTTDGVFQGKLGYAAPEQAKGEPGDRRADVFAAGVLLWEVLAFRRFTSKERTRAAVEARISGFEPRIQAVVPDVDPALAAICDRAMHVNPDLRYGTADELRLALTAYVQGRFPPIRVRLIGEAMRAMFGRDTATPRRAAEEEATTVGDLSVLIQSTLPTNSQPPPPDDSLPPAPEDEPPADLAPNRRPLIIAVSAAVVAVGTFFFSMSRQAPPDDPPAPVVHAATAAFAPPVVATAAPEPLPEPETSPAPSQSPSPSAEPKAPEASSKRTPGRPRASAPRTKGPTPAVPVHGIDENDPFR